ncbi:MAG: 3-deoxy-manno-octulosonate cytidylyltransferase [Synergistaceae bacterium]|jgi:3-deoxy-manno-octulosonate cytidylyltransferase (CMP-KDO synthetase)|nr:3-deoxy-manno-octulosonate cytidylyltransferase [Synergistaceae bacterium]
MIETLAVIPARYGSTRLPGKPLIKLRGRELVLRVLDGAKRSAADRVIVATDSVEILRVVQEAGGEAMMTPSMPTGGDRVAFVAREIPSRFVLNVQGDDPMVTPEMINPMIEALRVEKTAGLVVLVKRIEAIGEADRSSVVKVVMSASGLALYFSRAPIPWAEDNNNTARFKHVGPYAWRRDALFDFASLPRGPLEQSESLEMLRLLENGRAIRCLETDVRTIEIDTPEDIEAFERVYELPPF